MYELTKLDDNEFKKAQVLGGAARPILLTDGTAKGAVTRQPFVEHTISWGKREFFTSALACRGGLLYPCHCSYLLTGWRQYRCRSFFCFC
jgi:hypothetical protein